MKKVNIAFEELKDGQEILFEVDISGNGDYRFVKGVVKDNKSPHALSPKMFYQYSEYTDNGLSPVGVNILPHRMDEVKLIEN